MEQFNTVFSVCDIIPLLLHHCRHFVTLIYLRGELLFRISNYPIAPFLVTLTLVFIYSFIELLSSIKRNSLLLCEGLRTFRYNICAQYFRTVNTD